MDEGTKGGCSYQVLLFALGDSSKMEHQELQAVAVLLRQSLESFAEMIALFLRRRKSYVKLLADEGNCLDR
jgi:hypothetical protein